MASQKYFIPVVSAILMLSIIITFTSEVGFRRIRTSVKKPHHQSKPELDELKMYKVETMYEHVFIPTKPNNV